MENEIFGCDQQSLEDEGNKKEDKTEAADEAPREKKTLKKKYHVFTGSCMDYLPKIPKNSVDLIVTVPPQPVYISEPKRVFFKSVAQREEEKRADNEAAEAQKQLQDKRDLSIYSLQGWSVLVEIVLKQLYEVAKPESYCCWVVGDYREYQNERLNYVPLHSVLFTIAEKAGFKLHDIAVMDFSNFQEPKADGFPKEFCFNLNHGYLVVLKKVL